MSSTTEALTAIVKLGSVMEYQATKQPDRKSERYLEAKQHYGEACMWVKQHNPNVWRTICYSRHVDRPAAGKLLKRLTDEG